MDRHTKGHNPAFNTLRPRAARALLGNHLKIFLLGAQVQRKRREMMQITRKVQQPWPLAFYIICSWTERGLVA